MFDESYLHALAEQNADAQNYLYTYFARAIRLKLRARLRSPATIEDASQETFLRVLTYFRSGKTLNNPDNLPGFVHAICHNVALEFLRADTRHDPLPAQAPDPADTRSSPEHAIASSQNSDFVRTILDELSEGDRLLLRRVFLDEEDKDRVCSDLHVDRDYLRILLHRARRRMKTAVLRMVEKSNSRSGQTGKANLQLRR